jgi:hypothetical protein
MSKKMKVTIFAACALLMCLVTTSALAAYNHSQVSIYHNDTGLASLTQDNIGADLNTNSLSGYVESTYAFGTWNLEGNLYTKGSVFSVRRDSTQVAPYGYGTLYWANSGSETGKYFVSARASGGNHDGSCSVSQSGH